LRQFYACSEGKEQAQRGMDDRCFPTAITDLVIAHIEVPQVVQVGRVGQGGSSCRTEGVCPEVQYDSILYVGGMNHEGHTGGTDRPTRELQRHHSGQQRDMGEQIFTVLRLPDHVTHIEVFTGLLQIPGFLDHHPLDQTAPHYPLQSR
jgi:hypothetical protein